MLYILLKKEGYEENMENGEIVTAKEVADRIREWWIPDHMKADKDDFIWIREEGSSLKLSRVNVEECD